MKKTITILISLFMILSLVSCGNSANKTRQSSAEDKPAESITDYDKPVESDTIENDTNIENTDISKEQTEESGASENADIQKEQETKVLVAYFSATNTTEKVAEHIANGLNVDIYEIVPKEPYTDADLNYNSNSSRTTIEMNNPNARPAISGSVENMEQYDIVFIGYPIWWSEAPRIVSTFMESYDFSGKTIVPFCTSGGSGVGSSATNLEKLTKGADWLSGKRFNGSDSQDTIMEWVNSLELNLRN